MEMPAHLEHEETEIIVTRSAAVCYGPQLPSDGDESRTVEFAREGVLERGSVERGRRPARAQVSRAAASRRPPERLEGRRHRIGVGCLASSRTRFLVAADYGVCVCLSRHVGAEIE